MIEYVGEFDAQGWLQRIHVIEVPQLEQLEAQGGNYLEPVPGPVTDPAPSATCALRLVEGVVVWEETVPLADMQAAAIAKTYLDVDAVYDAAIGRRQTEYVKAEAEARAFAAAGYSGECGAYVTGFAQNNPTGEPQSNQWSAQQIIGRADAFAAAELAMRNTRFARQAGMRAATTIQALATVVASWDAFIAGLRAQLGL